MTKIITLKPRDGLFYRDELIIQIRKHSIVFLAVVGDTSNMFEISKEKFNKRLKP